MCLCICPFSVLHNILNYSPVWKILRHIFINYLYLNTFPLLMILPKWSIHGHAYLKLCVSPVCLMIFSRYCKSWCRNFILVKSFPYFHAKLLFIQSPRRAVSSYNNNDIFWTNTSNHPGCIKYLIFRLQGQSQRRKERKKLHFVFYYALL